MQKTRVQFLVWEDPLGKGVLGSHPLQDSYLDSPIDRGDWWAAVHGVTKSQSRLSDFTSFPALTLRMGRVSRKGKIVTVNVLSWSSYIILGTSIDKMSGSNT